MEHLALRFPEITSLMYVVNTKFNDTIGDLDIQCYKGRDHIFEEMEGLRFKIGPKSFYQTNSAQAYELYRVAREFAELGGGEVVYDLSLIHISTHLHRQRTAVGNSQSVRPFLSLIHI